jgi:hypothetical protein
MFCAFIGRAEAPFWPAKSAGRRNSDIVAEMAGPAIGNINADPDALGGLESGTPCHRGQVARRPRRVSGTILPGGSE